MLSPTAMLLAGLLSQQGSWGNIGRGQFLMAGVDLSPRPGFEISYVDMDAFVWIGGVGAVAWDLETEGWHGVLAAEAGFTFVGAEAGFAITPSGDIGARWRALISGGPISVYGEYLSLYDCPWSLGLLVKLPVEM